MELSRILSYKSAIAPVMGLVAGVALIALLAPSPPPEPPEPPVNRENRPNISSLKLPDRLDFAGEPVPMNDPEVRKRMDREFLLNLQWDGQVMLYLKRSGEYFEMYDRILKEENAPADLKFLSVAESALFQAQSSAGAVGLWQFIPATGKRYGLRIDEYVDERRHPEKSTRAAIRLLKDNYRRFDSWALSAAAYNMGEAAVEDDLSFQGGRSYYDLYMNEETSRYLFRVVAIKEILSNPERYGYFLNKSDYYSIPPTRLVSVSEEIPNLAQWARAQGTSYKHVKLLNPWILKRTLPKPGGQPYQIAVPVRGGE